MDTIRKKNEVFQSMVNQLNSSGNTERTLEEVWTKLKCLRQEVFRWRRTCVSDDKRILGLMEKEEHHSLEQPLWDQLLRIMETEVEFTFDDSFEIYEDVTLNDYKMKTLTKVSVEYQEINERLVSALKKKRERNRNFTQAEVDILLKMYAANRSILNCKKLGSETARKKLVVYQKMVKRLNACPGAKLNKRTLAQVRQKVTCMRKEAGRWRRHQQGEPMGTWKPQSDVKALQQIIRIMESQGTSSDNPELDLDIDDSDEGTSNVASEDDEQDTATNTPIRIGSVTAGTSDTPIMDTQSAITVKDDNEEVEVFMQDGENHLVIFNQSQWSTRNRCQIPAPVHEDPLNPWACVDFSTSIREDTDNSYKKAGDSQSSSQLKRERGRNFTQSEVDIMLNVYEKYRKIMNSSSRDEPINRQKLAILRVMADRLNKSADTRVNKRTVGQVSIKLSHMKKEASRWSRNTKEDEDKGWLPQLDQVTLQRIVRLMDTNDQSPSVCADLTSHEGSLQNSENAEKRESGLVSGLAGTQDSDGTERNAENSKEIPVVGVTSSGDEVEDSEVSLQDSDSFQSFSERRVPPVNDGTPAEEMTELLSYIDNTPLMNKKRERNRNYTLEELNIMLDVFEEYRTILMNCNTNTRTNRRKMAVFQIMTDRLNQYAGAKTRKRRLHQVRKKFARMKKEALTWRRRKLGNQPHFWRFYLEESILERVLSISGCKDNSDGPDLPSLEVSVADDDGPAPKKTQVNSKQPDAASQGNAAKPCSTNPWDSADPSVSSKKVRNRSRNFLEEEVDIMLNVYSENREVLNGKGMDSVSYNMRLGVFQIMVDRLNEFADQKGLSHRTVEQVREKLSYLKGETSRCIRNKERGEGHWWQPQLDKPTLQRLVRLMDWEATSFNVFETYQDIAYIEETTERSHTTENNKKTGRSSPAMPETPSCSDTEATQDQSITQNHTFLPEPETAAAENNSDNDDVGLEDPDSLPSLFQLPEVLADDVNHSCAPSEREEVNPLISIDLSSSVMKQERKRNCSKEEMDIIVNVYEANRELLISKSKDRETSERKLAILQTMIDRLGDRADTFGNDDDKQTGEKRGDSVSVIQKRLDSLQDNCGQLRRLGVEAGTILFEGDAVLCCGSDRLKHIADHHLLPQILSEWNTTKQKKAQSVEEWTIRIPSASCPNPPSYHSTSPVLPNIVCTTPTTPQSTSVVLEGQNSQPTTAEPLSASGAALSESMDIISNDVHFNSSSADQKSLENAEVMMYEPLTCASEGEGDESILEEVDDVNEQSLIADALAVLDSSFISDGDSVKMTSDVGQTLQNNLIDRSLEAAEASVSNGLSEKQPQETSLLMGEHSEVSGTFETCVDIMDNSSNANDNSNVAATATTVNASVTSANDVGSASTTSSINLNIDSSNFMFCCPWCSAAFSRLSSFVQHTHSHEETGDSSGQLGTGREGAESAETSLQSSKSVQEDKYKCKECHKGFPTRNKLREHQRTHWDGKPLECNICGKRFLVKSRLVRHMNRHLGICPFQCELCGVKVSEKVNLKVHMRVHTGEKPFACEVCGKAYRCQSALVVHRRRHTGERPFLCDVCGKTFIQGGLLTIHRRLHSGERPFKCQDCGEGFIVRKTLTIHRRKHTGIEPHKCPICGKCFQRAKHLNIHVRLHTGEKPYSCKLCGKKFHRSDVLALHKKGHDPSTKPPPRKRNRSKKSST